MGLSEFDLISRYFTRAAPSAALGVGDDAALLSVAPGMELAVSTDMLVAGTHFFADADPQLLGHKALAVNLSDLAAMGAAPRWATLALALPEANEAWLEAFSRGFFELAERHGVELVGGDTTRGPLNLCVTIMGEVPHGAALKRSGASAGDDIWISGRIGDAALALAHLQGRVKLTDADFASCAGALHQPAPRVALGMALRGIASSAIDISDGLLADLGHILDASKVAAKLDYRSLPLSDVLRPHRGTDIGRRCSLAGGDDYELCFTAPAAAREKISAISAAQHLALTRIGEITAGCGCSVTEGDDRIALGESGYDHFT